VVVVWHRRVAALQGNAAGGGGAAGERGERED
jgi:hypothetical protein